ncbi:hypothetical protein BC332_05676 [Capsicum chinense]|uniref:Late embryogenesis abundant protein LEA-2 subgroup domain-containing protein n=1 Tax=Capsicum annuum TaxID=4072 RepID=A0A1U8FID2_CAPAN|nr:uncharacterized protein LOC107858333 [Capsicum annuum]KAF3613840.1 hypothetical protein FXO38_36009 [Capsicum annuum]KAF3621176.1 hypothetical protein FXO37_32948 [Capsicum annuum]PHT91496.1 hypothetical protein T459_06609 [Capsicum annuum]PHU27344.1 hypothetical protein BC332_05676 [Capsicum chinense]
MGCCNSRTKKALKIGCGFTVILLLTILIVAITLYFTILKPKDPKVTTQSVTLESIRFEPFPAFHLNVTIGLILAIHNRNYGSFKYDSSIANVTYRGDPAAEALIIADTIPARADHDLNTTVLIDLDGFSKNPNFLGDLFSGCLNFTSSTILHGKVTVWKVMKLKATTVSTCDISVFTKFQNATSVCKSKIKF